MTKRSLKEKEILFPGSYDNVKINESTKAFRLIDDQCSWVTINLTAPTTSTRYLKRIPSLQAHRATAAPAWRAGHGSMSARARGAPPCKKYNLERGNRPSIQLPTPSPIISFITWMLQGIFGFETLRRYERCYTANTGVYRVIKGFFYIICRENPVIFTDCREIPVDIAGFPCRYCRKTP